MKQIYKQIDNIVVIQTAFLGDAILTLPFIQKLKELYPNSEVDIITNPPNHALFEGLKSINCVYVFDKRGKHKSIRSMKRFAKELKPDYDILFCLHRSARSAILSSFIKAKEKIGFSNSSLSFIFNKVVEYVYTDHEVKRNINLLEQNIENWRIVPELILRDESLIKVRTLFENKFQENLIVIAPRSIWETKQYPWESYLKIIKALLTRYEVAIIGSEQDYEFITKNTAPDYLLKIHNFCGKLNVIETIEFLKRSSLLIANDSAPTHMGAVADIKVLTIYCSTVPEFGFYPYNEKSDYIGIELECKPCGIHGFHECPRKNFNCGLNLNPDTVLQKAYQMLDEKS